MDWSNNYTSLSNLCDIPLSLYAGNTPQVLNIQTSEEQELVARVRKGDRKAQYILYKAYVDAMYHTALRIVNDSADAQDIVQECFVKVFEKINSYRGDATIGAWIKRIVINTAINVLRRKKRSLEYSSENIEDFQHVIEEENTDNPLDNKIIHSAILELPTGCRSVLNLYLFEGYSHKEVADILEISESTSKTQYRRAKILLRTSLNSKYA